MTLSLLIRFFFSGLVVMALAACGATPTCDGAGE